VHRDSATTDLGERQRLNRPPRVQGLDQARPLMKL